jgi:hypothetical protein
MPVEFWIGQDFDTTQERRALATFLEDMQSRYGQSKQLYLVLANYFLDSRQIDLTVLKHDAIVVIELKECAAPLLAAENGAWTTIPDGVVIGTSNQNPFEQVRDYRIRWINYLADHQTKFLSSAKACSLDFTHVSAFVAISPTLHPKTENRLAPNLIWFQLVGLDKLAQAVYQQTSRKLDFSDDELHKLFYLT